MPKERKFRDQWLSRVLVKAGARFATALDKIEVPEGGFLSGALVEQGVISAEELGRLVERNFRIPYRDPEPESLDKMALKLLPDRLCRRHLLIPVGLEENSLQVLMANPLDLDAQSDATVVSGRELKVYFCAADRVRQLIDAAYGPERAPAQDESELAEGSVLEVVEEKSEEDLEAEDAGMSGPVSKLVNHIFVSAVKMRASDIHIEQQKERTIVRFRIDGTLRNIMQLPKRLGTGPLVSRIKIMGNMDVADRRRPMDGRARVKVDGFEIGLRLSTLPTSFGEKVVVRILDKRQAEIPFESLGFRSEIRSRLESILKSPKGMFLVTGSTGSGKTTTLYSCLHRLKSEAINIVTVEDPVEYKLDGINQVQVNEKAGLTFAAVLRSVLRQDPDAILIGEIRDRETAEIGLQAAMTGHAVFSTLHANDCVSTISRLEQMGVERFKLASALNAVSAQRLVRKLCLRCRKALAEREIPPAVLRAFEARGLAPRLFAASGCAACGGIGYRGRQVVVELLTLPQEGQDLIAQGVDEGSLLREALKKGWLLPMSDDLYWHLSNGNTSWEEVSAALEEASGPKEPAAQAQRRQAPMSGGIEKVAQLGLAGKDILVIDDEEPVRKLIRRIAEANGCSVREACDGVEGLKMFEDQPPDLAILDLNMPEMDGMEVIKAIRGRLSFWNVPIMISTVLGGAESQELALDLGADDYVAKPFEPQVLLARMKALFRRAEWTRASELKAAEEPALAVAKA